MGLRVLILYENLTSLYSEYVTTCKNKAILVVHASVSRLHMCTDSIPHKTGQGGSTTLVWIGNENTDCEPVEMIGHLHIDIVRDGY